MNQVTSQYLLDRVVRQSGSRSHGDALGRHGFCPGAVDTSLIEVSQNTDRVLAVSIANTIASEFVQSVSEMNQERMPILTFLAEQEAVLKADLEPPRRFQVAQAKPENAASLTRDIATRIGDRTLEPSWQVFRLM